MGYQKLIRLSPQLVAAIQDNLGQLSQILLSKNILAPGNVQEINNEEKTREWRASRMLEILRNKVQVDSSIYNVFVQALKDHSPQYNNILKLLREIDSGKKSSSDGTEPRSDGDTSDDDTPGNGTSVSIRLVEDDIANLYRLLKNHAYAWKNIGLSLGFQDSELTSISVMPSLFADAPAGYLRQLLSQLVQWPTDSHREEPTLDKLCAALRSKIVGLGCLADEVYQEMKQTRKGGSTPIASDSSNDNAGKVNDKARGKSTPSGNPSDNAGKVNDEVRGRKYDLHSKRGLAILVHCDYNHDHTKHLTTTKYDGEEMEHTFRELKYDVHTISNEKATKKEVDTTLDEVEAYLKQYDRDGEPKNSDGGYKVIVFAFAGHGGSGFIKTVDWERIEVMHIVNKFMGNTGTVMKIPKLFFFDSCRGDQFLIGATHRGNEQDEVNYRIDYANIPEHAVRGEDEWMCLVAKTIRDEPHKSLGDIMAIVKEKIYVDSKKIQGEPPQLPETVDRLVTGPLMLHPKK